MRTRRRADPGRRPWPRLGLAALALLTAVALGACSDDDAPGADAGADARADAAPPPDAAPVDGGGLAPLEVTVFTYGLAPDATDLPAAGAQVAVELGDGRQLEAPTDAAGQVRFAAVDFGPGPVAVTAYLPDHAVSSLVQIPESAGAVSLRLLRPEPAPETVTLSGSGQGMQDPGNVLSVTSSAGTTVHHAVGPAFSVEVRPGRPSVLLAMEWWPGMITPSGRGVENTIHQWHWQPVPPLADATSLPIDFGVPVTAEAVQGSFPIPTRPESDFQRFGVGFLGVTSPASGLLVGLGLPTRVDINAAGTAFDFELEHLVPPGIEDPITMFLFVNDPWQVDIWAFVATPGVPEPGLQDIAFIDRPAVLAPATPAGQGLREPVAWEHLASDHLVVMQIHRYQTLVWEVYAASDQGTLTVPRLPSTADAADLLGTEPLDARVLLFRMHPSGKFLSHGTYTEWLTLNP